MRILTIIAVIGLLSIEGCSKETPAPIEKKATSTAKLVDKVNNPVETVPADAKRECGPDRTRCIECGKSWCCAIDEICIYDGSCLGGCKRM